jgi:acyl carrier protein
MSVHDSDRAVTRDEQAEDPVATEVLAAVADSLNLTAADISPGQALEADLGIDSLGMIQIGVALEHSLGFRAPDIEDALAVETVADLVELVRAQLASR